MTSSTTINKKHLLITRAESQARELGDLCLENDIVPVLCAMIEIKPVEVICPTYSSNKSILSVFTSKNAIRPEILEFCKDTEIAVIGKETARRVGELNYTVNLISSGADEKSLGADILARYSNTNFEINLYQGNTSSDYLVDLLKEAGFVVTKYIVYEVCPATYSEGELKNFIKSSLENPESYIISLLSAYTAEVFFSELKKILAEDLVRDVLKTVNFVVLGNGARKVLEREGVVNVELVGEKSVRGVVDVIVRK